MRFDLKKRGNKLANYANLEKHIFVDKTVIFGRTDLKFLMQKLMQNILRILDFITNEE